MNATGKRSIQTWLKHIHVLAGEIGPRGSTTEAERQASEYCEQILTGLGYSPQVEPFTSARSIFTPHLIASAAMLAAFAVYPLYGRVSAGVAAAISLIALASDLLELSFRDNVLRRLVPKGPSQNVIAKLPPGGEHRQDVILIGHVDSQRTPIIFSSQRWLDAYKAFTTVAFAAFSGQVILYVLGTVTQWDWIWPTTVISAVCAALLAALCIQADLSPFSPGANDNATAAGLVLTLAEDLKAEPLRHTRVWLACTGCEEVQHYGAIDFFRRHRAELHHPKALVLEMLGCAGPAWLTREGIVIPFHADGELVALIERLSAEHPEWEAHPTRINGGNTEMADALLAGVPAITFLGATPEGDTPYWHQPEDTVDKMDPDVMARAYDMTRAFISALDESVSD